MYTLPRYPILGTLAFALMVASPPSSFAKPCPKDALARSIAELSTITADLDATYLRGGGGIQSIQRKATGIYLVRLPQEGRVDLLTYTLGWKKCRVVIRSKAEDVKSFRK